MDKTGLDLLRQPFPAHQVSKLPKPTKAQTEAVKQDFKKGIRCELCGAWHHPDVIHLDYVGHAALTDRLLDADPMWNWEPMTIENGLPSFDHSGGLWIRLTICGVTRLGYGHAATKGDFADPGSREKEVIGDALRNAAMRFGAALDLWHKGDLHIDDEPPKEPQNKLPTTDNTPKKIDTLEEATIRIKSTKNITELMDLWPLIMIKVKGSEGFKDVWFAQKKSFPIIDRIEAATNARDLALFVDGTDLTEQEQDAFNAKMDSLQ